MAFLSDNQKLVDSPIAIATLYRFARFEEPAVMRISLLEQCRKLGIRGTIVLAQEGINGTVAASPAAVEALLAHLRTLPGCAALDVTYSSAKDPPFARMKIKVKREIVTMRAGDVDPARNAGTYVEPCDWNALISDPDTILVDTRNDYEVAIGSFAGAIDPDLTSFSAFPAWLADAKARWEREGRAAPRVAMFCTGGIRCEKSTALARGLGLNNVYHLKGGILRYLEEIPENQSLWRGNCFVFDERISVGHGLVPSSDILCDVCGWPHRSEQKHRCAAPEEKKPPRRAAESFRRGCLKGRFLLHVQHYFCKCE